MISLGCPKALVDSERILTRLRAEGYQISAEYQESDLVLVNTCGFIDAAVEESMDAIAEAMHENGRVVVTGCLGADAERIQRAFPEILAVTGPHAYDQVMTAIHEQLPPAHDPFTDLIPPQGIRLTPPHYAYLKISEGCNHRCSFCVIPQMRGDLVSRPISEVMAEAERLVAAGVKELLVISQDTSAYGVDLKYRTHFWNGRPLRTNLEDLVRALGSLGVWVRLHYVYPYPHVDKIIPRMSVGDILPYLDIPMQHASQQILRAMRRPANSDRMLERIREWRALCPNIVIRSTFIVGFPGETELDFEELLAFLEEAELDRVGGFTYSPVDGASANELPDALPQAVKEERLERLMSLQAEISAKKLARRVGTVMTVLIDEIDEEGIVARSYADAPEIDGRVFIEAKSSQENTENSQQGVATEEQARLAALKVGDWAQVLITNSDEHDLVAHLTPATL